MDSAEVRRRRRRRRGRVRRRRHSLSALCSPHYQSYPFQIWCTHILGLYVDLVKNVDTRRQFFVDLRRKHTKKIVFLSALYSPQMSSKCRKHLCTCILVQQHGKVRTWLRTLHSRMRDLRFQKKCFSPPKHLDITSSHYTGLKQLLQMMSLALYSQIYFHCHPQFKIIDSKWPMSAIFLFINHINT